MKRYETAEFRADDSGIALLRSRYAYKKNSYQEIDEFQIRKGKVVNNSIAVLILGVLLLAAGLYVSGIFGPLNLPGAQLGLRGGKVLGYYILLILGLLCFGSILIYKSLKRDFVLEIKTENFKKSYPLTELRKKRELNRFMIELKEKAGDKLTLLTRELI